MKKVGFIGYMDALLAQGNGDLDHSAVALLLEQLSASNENKS